MKKVIFCICRGREMVWVEAYEKVKELDKIAQMRRAIVADLAAEGMSKERIKEFVSDFGL
ncbi:hypothetical protein QTL97_16865 [Sporosarcina thermotolerans]|uniref:Uncharacterized protein n=1 Tax=Sporosarcina thermotolerans TaxID=633404 RepID=A0AAW9AC28_9BACL|nr:hypothetical protein [Sporosarcina thermotolerans]MDW0118599.1 hypothetical protein [Sporosarcina thermotolerans]